MRHKKRSMRKRGGAWEDFIPSFLKAKPATPTQIVNDPAKVVGQAQTVTDQTVGNAVGPLGAEKEETGVPGGMSPQAPAAQVGARRRRKTRKHRSKRRY